MSRDVRRGARATQRDSPKVSMRSAWPDLWALIRPRRRLLAFGLGLIAINRLAGLVLPGSVKFLVDDVIVGRRTDALLPILAAVLAATFVQGLTAFALTQNLSKAAQRMIADLRQTVQSHVGRLPVAFYDATTAGALVSRIMYDVDGARVLIGTGFVNLIGGMLAALIALALMFSISPVMTAMTLVTLSVFGFVIFRAFRILEPIYRERSEIQADVSGRLAESLGGVRVIKGYRAEEREARVFAGGVGRLLANILRSLTANSVMSLASSVLLGVVGAAVMYVGARQVLAGHLTVGGLFTYTILLGFLAAPIFEVVTVGAQVTEALAGLTRTRELLTEPTEDADPRRTVALSRLRGEVAFEDVVFSYDKEREVLQGVSLGAGPGTVTALVGPSGAGKSTVIALLAGFHVPVSGRVLVDGVDLATVRFESYRSQLGMVLQDTFLFDGTIRENVAFSRPDAAEQDVLRACRLARVDEFAESFEKGYETVVGERGVRLSGGQRQRVAIARAILADPRILILDEATSSLDSESEALIQEGLAHLMRGRTTFVIAHRLSTIRRADQILVLEEGRIVERGTHAALYASGGRYRQMYDRQHGVAANLFLAPGEGETEPEPAAERQAEPAVPNLPEPLRLLGT